jgi:hypothetical protein
MHHEVGHEYEKLTTTEERRAFVLKYGEDRGKVMWDTRKQASDGARCEEGESTTSTEQK